MKSTQQHELLVLAAKATDRNIITADEDTGGLLVGYQGIVEMWNPLASYSDALLLALDLNINVYISDTCCCAEMISDSDEPALIRREYCDAATKYAAVRTAIVRVAAEYGKHKD